MARILIVENSPLMRPALRDLLTIDGHTVVTAVHVLEAISKLEKETFDLLIINCMLLEMMGFDQVRRLRAEAGDVTLPVLAFSVRDDIRLRQQALNAGADLFLGPPVTVGEFKANVWRLLPDETLDVSLPTQSVPVIMWGEFE